MTGTSDYLELVAAVRREGSALIAAAGQGLEQSVPTCGEWTVADLVEHMVTLWLFWADNVEARRTEPGPRPSMPAGDPLVVAADALDALVEALSACTAETPVWNWSNQPHTAYFVARRMAHELAIHRYDAQRAFDVAQPVDPELALDGLDELADVILPRVAMREGVELPATIALVATEEGGSSWVLSGTARAAVGTPADVTVRGTPSALLLAAYNRIPWSSLSIEGDAAALEAWSSTVRF